MLYEQLWNGLAARIRSIQCKMCLSVSKVHCCQSILHADSFGKNDPSYKIIHNLCKNIGNRHVAPSITSIADVSTELLGLLGKVWVVCELFGD